MINTVDIVSCSQEELKALFHENGEPDYRAKQLFSWIHQKQASSFDEMSNLPASLRRWLKENTIMDVSTNIEVLREGIGIAHGLIVEVRATLTHRNTIANTDRPGYLEGHIAVVIRRGL